MSIFTIIGHSYRGTAVGLFDLRRCIGKMRMVRVAGSWVAAMGMLMFGWMMRGQG